MRSRTLTHLQQLEAESIHIIREVVAEFENPVMLYSIGKDSSVMVRLAQKAFHPGPLPFPLLHVDTNWKFREMIEFRDKFCSDHGLQLIVHTNQAVEAQSLTPFTAGSKRWTDVLKTQALLEALTAGGFDAAFGGARRDEENARGRRSGSTRSAIATVSGTRRTSGPSCGISTTDASPGARASASFRCRTGPSSTSGSTSTSSRSPWSRSTSPPSGRSSAGMAC